MGRQGEHGMASACTLAFPFVPMHVRTQHPSRSAEPEGCRSVDPALALPYCVSLSCLPLCGGDLSSIKGSEASTEKKGQCCGKNEAGKGGACRGPQGAQRVAGTCKQHGISIHLGEQADKPAVVWRRETRVGERQARRHGAH